MHVLFVHQNYPAQFGHVAAWLVREHGFRCTFVSERPAGNTSGVERIQYHVRGGATAQNHYCSRTFENATWHAHAVYEALKARPDIRPDLIVGHSGFGSTLFLSDLYHGCPIINYFEYFYQARNSDMDFRPDYPSSELNRLRVRTRNAAILLDLENCDAGYSPTQWQRSLLPQPFQHKLNTIFDGIDTSVWCRQRNVPRRIAGRTIPDGTRIVTYVARGFESMRGFDIFMKTARLICDQRQDVIFIVVGEDRGCYGDDQAVTGVKSYRQWVLAQDNYDLSRFVFTGRIPPQALARLLSISDLHIYLTVPFVLSWSLMNTLACGTTVLASDTAPVREMITHEKNGLLADFFDVDSLAAHTNRVLDDPLAFRHLGTAGEKLVREEYSIDACLPRTLRLYRQVAAMDPNESAT